MDKKRIGKGLVAGGILGVFLYGIAAIFLFCNRLREIETNSFTVAGSHTTRIITVGIENWFPLFLTAIFLVAISFFFMSYGFSLMKK